MADRNRIVRISTVSQNRIIRKDKDELIKWTMIRLDWASTRNPDIVVLPEGFPDNRNEPEEVPGRLTNMVAEWAKEHNCYALCPIRTKAGDLEHNSSILIDRKGEVIGQYDKIHLTEGEIDGGLSPAVNPDPPVFETDFGTIGMQICFDINWPSTWTRLKEKGAEIVFFSSAYPALRQIIAHAWRNQYYVVSSTKGGVSAIIDISGEILGKAGSYSPWVEASLPLGKQLFEIDYHVKKMRDIEMKYGPKVEVQWFHEMDWVTLASLDPDLTVEDIIKEFELTPYQQYIERAGKNIEETRAKLTNNR